MTNLARLLLDRASERPDALLGTVDSPLSLDALVERAAEFAGVLAGAGVEPRDRVALVGSTSTAYLTAWAGLQLLGAEAALVNPTYPDAMLTELIGDLDPAALVVVDRGAPEGGVASLIVDASDLAAGTVQISGRAVEVRGVSAATPGTSMHPLDIAGYMHTSGTTGRPKFCAQSHRYFLRLGSVIADALSITERDVVFAPLPMFHINPLGYGLVGGLTAGASVLAARRFSATEFWDDVERHDVSVLVLHGPPLEILNKGPARANPVRSMFWANADFMERFEVETAVSAYGSTEGGGVSHLRRWNLEAARGAGDVDISRLGGDARDDIEWRVDGDGRIRLRGREPGVLFSGYLRDGRVDDPCDADGWFDTGDLGESGEAGLRFIERGAESIRVKGEYVPIPMVEAAYSGLSGVADVAVWKRPGPLGGDEVVLYTAPVLPEIEQVRAASEGLPGFMRAVAVVAVADIPRDDGVGKVRRTVLDTLPRTGEVEL